MRPAVVVCSDDMRSTPTPPPEFESRPAGGIDWPPVGGAFAASALIHALALAAVATVLARAPAAATPGAIALPIQAMLVSHAPPAVPERPPPAVVRTAQAVAPAPPARAPEPSAPAPAPEPAPWAAMPRSVDLPASFFEPPVLAEGVAFFETRNRAALDERIDRRIAAEYPGEPRYPVILKSPEALGYPLDVLAKGIEGRVLLWFGVDEEGKVIDREALDGPPELVEWVLPRLDRIVDKPARDELKPVRGWVALEIDFSRDAAEAARAMRAAAEDRARRDEERAEAREPAK